MGARGWYIISWLWLAISVVGMALGVPSLTVWGTMLAAIIARGIGEILEAIAKAQPPK